MKLFDPTDTYSSLASYKVFDVSALPDSGANKSLISLRTIQAQGIKIGTTSSVSVSQAGEGSSLKGLGCVDLNVFFEGHVTPINALVVSDLREDFLLSWQDLLNMHILPTSYPHVTFTRVAPNVGANVSVNEVQCEFQQLIEEYSDVFDEEALTPMAGPPMHIHLRRDDPDYKPLRISIARRTPLHFKGAADRLIKELLERGVIEKVPTNEDIEWCSPGFFVPKPDGKVRLVTDYRQINKFISRPVHPFPSPKDIVRGVKPTSSWFLKFDAVHGYFQVPLDEESSKLTTFLVESGRYRFLRAPMGLNPSSDHFCERSDNVFASVEDLLKIVDDGLIQASTRHDLLIKFKAVLECCRKNSLTLSRSKLQFGQSVVFAGYQISQDGIKPLPQRTDAIRNFPVPTNISELRGFLGLVNQLGVFVPDLAHVTTPLRGLLKKNVAFIWLTEHQQAFQQTKDILLSDLVTRPFDPTKPTQLLTDASRLKGLGYALIQRTENSLSLIQCGSRSLLPAESRYSTTELECLAIYYAVKDCSFFLQGTDFSVLTDHKPLVGTFLKPLSEIENARLLRFREKLAHFSFVVNYVAGKFHLIADALSRAPVFDPPEKEVFSNTVLVNAISTDPSLQNLYDFAENDSAYKQIREAILSNVDINDLPPNHPGRSFSSVWNDLSVHDDVLLVVDNSRIVIPKAARPDILKKLHTAHAGVTKTRQMARNLYFWPGMSNEIKLMIECCDLCQRLRAHQHDEPQQHPNADAPMHCVSMDLFSWAGKDYLVMIDRFSSFIWVSHLSTTTTRKVLDVIDRWYLDIGYPLIILTDNGPQFRTEFTDYCSAKHIRHVTSSPYNPRSNGLAESAVKTAKYLLQKSDNFADFQRRLLAWRNLPLSNSALSPNELFYNRQVRTDLPVLKLVSDTSRPIYDTSALPKFNVGDKVVIFNEVTDKWDQKGTILEIRDTGLSYLVSATDGPPCVRGRRLLKPDHCPVEPPSSPTSTPPPPTQPTPTSTPRRSNRRRRRPRRFDD